MTASSGDGQSAFLAELRNPNRRKLRKVQPVVARPIAIVKDVDPEAEKQDIYIEMLGYMQAPGGNIEELTEKCKNLTNTNRGFIFTLIRRGWLAAFRLLDVLESAPDKPCEVWPGREVISAVKIPNVADERALPATEVFRCHMYRFDQTAKRHTLDTLVFVAGPRFPIAVPAFAEREPSTANNSLQTRQAWEAWNLRKTQHEQSDHPQYTLIATKLSATDLSVVSAFKQLMDTISDIRGMSEALRGVFGACSVWELRRVVESIPNRIKEVKKRLELDSGIIIRDDAVKLTPEFLARGWDSEKKKAGNGSAEHENAALAAEEGSSSASVPPSASASTRPQSMQDFGTAFPPSNDEEELAPLSLPLDAKIQALLRKPTALKVDGIPANFLLGLLQNETSRAKRSNATGARVVRRAPTI
ncbi:hypothetical protein HKX48_006320 [Thoreauomyces humboldtii]|nr:hypothetical protein HKX48_006320 [Thoreauomyces humboldtii]